MHYHFSHYSVIALAILTMVNAEDIMSFPISAQLINNAQKEINSPLANSFRGASRRLQELSPESIPLYQDYGAYYVDIHMGSPPQRQTFLVDTGSENTGTPCAGCKDCGSHIYPDFNKKSSRSFSELTCSECMTGRCNSHNNTCYVSSSYAEKSGWNGNEAKDVGRINSIPGGNKDAGDFNFKFTCMEENDGAFKTQISNGILGMNTHRTAFWRQLYDQGSIKSKQFSICMNNHPLGKHLVGALTLGGVDKRMGHSASDMSYMDFTDEDNLFKIEIRKMYVLENNGDQTASDKGNLDFTINDAVAVEANELILNSGGVKLDSGTTGSLMSPIIKESFLKAWERATNKKFPLKDIDLSPEELKSWPTIVFQMKGSLKQINLANKKRYVFDDEFPNDLIVALPPSQYMYLNLRTGTYSNLLKFDGAHGKGSLLGSNFMRSYNVLFNMETHTIGMIKSDCNYVDGRQHKRIEVPDQYPSFSQIKMWYSNDLCTIEHQYYFCISRFVYNYKKVVTFLLFLLTFAALYTLLLSEKVERTDVSFLSGTDQFSQPLLEKMA